MSEKPESDPETAPSGLGGSAFEAGRALSAVARALIPGGAHTYAKGADQFPEQAPPFLVRGRGCRVWDLDGNQYIEFALGLRAVTLGHAYAPVIEAAQGQILLGANFNRPAPIEVDCARQFLDLIPTADMVKFCKDGSTAIDAGIRLARAHTGRDMIAACADQPFFSTGDWFIQTTGMPAGIPDSMRELVVRFPYNDLAALEQLFAQHPGRIACVVLEPARTLEPAPGYLQGLKELCRRNGTVLLFDEMITGFRWHRSGAQQLYGVTPDLSAFGKALANGFALSALCGRRELMELGGEAPGRDRVFLLSTTHGAETHAMAAAIATMRVYRDEPVIEHLHRQGGRLRRGVEQAIAAHGLQQHFVLHGRNCCLLFETRDRDGRPSQSYRALFLQELIKGGVIAPSFIVSYSHTDQDIDLAIDIIADALAVYGRALQEGIEKFLVGRPVKPVFRRRW